MPSCATDAAVGVPCPPSIPTGCPRFRLPPPGEEAGHWCSATRRTASRTASADGPPVAGQSAGVTGGVAPAACCRRATSASRAAT
jgi:hypothetical protein